MLALFGQKHPEWRPKTKQNKRGIKKRCLKNTKDEKSIEIFGEMLIKLGEWLTKNSVLPFIYKYNSYQQVLNLQHWNLRKNYYKAQRQQVKMFTGITFKRCKSTKLTPTYN